MFPGRTGLLARNPARPRPAVPLGAPTRPARGISGFWIRQACLEPTLVAVRSFRLVDICALDICALDICLESDRQNEIHFQLYCYLELATRNNKKTYQHNFLNMPCIKLVESKTRTYHGRFGSARHMAGRRGAAGPGRTGSRRVGWLRSQPSV